MPRKAVGGGSSLEMAWHSFAFERPLPVRCSSVVRKVFECIICFAVLLGSMTLLTPEWTFGNVVVGATGEKGDDDQKAEKVIHQHHWFP